MRTTIIGGGVIGLCTAYYLNREGYEVTVIDKNDITDGCSFGNMGYISPSHFIPLASPGIIAKGLKWMLSPSSPFYIKPRLNWELLRWGLTFWKNSNQKKMDESIPRLNDLLQLSRHLMVDFKRDLNGSFELIEKGIWALYKTEKTGDHEKHLAKQGEALGLKTLMCTAAEVQAREPEVEIDVRGGVLWLDDCHVDAAKFMRALVDYLKGKGVRFLLNTDVMAFEKINKNITGILTQNEKVETDEVIVAAGSRTPEVARLAGVHLLMQPGKGYSVVYENVERNLQHPSILVEARTAMTPIRKWLRIGGTMELSGHSDNIMQKRVSAIYKAVKDYYPGLKVQPPQADKAWFGYRPVTPDGMPYIGKHSKYSNLTFAGGHAMLGVSAAAATGKLVDEIISHKPTSIDIAAFDVERF